MRWIIRLVGIVAILALLPVVALLAMPTERVAAVVTERISAATGREVVIEGPLRPALWPSPGIRAEGLRVGNPDWVDAGPLLAAESLHVSVEWAPLLQGQVRLGRAELNGPDITLVRDAQGRTSWDFSSHAAQAASGDGENGGTEGGTGTARGDFAIGFDHAEIRGGRLRWIDQVSGRDISVTGAHAILSLPSAVGRATVTASAEIDGAALEIAFSVDGPGALLDGLVRPASGEVSWTGGRAAFEGRIALAPALDGNVEFEATDIGPLLSLAGSTRPVLPPGLGRDRVAARGDVTLTNEGSIHLREGALSLDDNELAVELDVRPGEERPLVRGTVSADRLSLATLREDPSTGSGDSRSNRSDMAPGWSTDPIDVSGLFSADGALALRVRSLDLGLAEIGPVEVDATLTRGRLVLDIGRVGAYGGLLAGEFVVNGRGGLSVGGDLSLAGVQLNPLLGEFAGFDRLDGNGNASFQFLGVGNDLATIMSGLEGEGDLAFGAGAILGLDIGGMIRNLDASFRGEGERTVYDSITANLTIDEGIVSNDDLLLDAPWGTVRGEGTVNLGARTVDYRVIPGVMRDETGQSGVEVPVLVSGPWSSLRFQPDLEYLAEQEFLEQRDRIAAEAEERLEAERERIEGEIRDRATELLGTETEAGDGREEIEGALQDRLADEVDDVLSDLLGGGSD